MVAKQSEKVLAEFDAEAMMHSDGESEDNMDDTHQDLALDLPRHFMSVSPRGNQALNSKITKINSQTFTYRWRRGR